MHLRDARGSAPRKSCDATLKQHALRCRLTGSNLWSIAQAFQTCSLDEHARLAPRAASSDASESCKKTYGQTDRQQGQKRKETEMERERENCSSSSREREGERKLPPRHALSLSSADRRWVVYNLSCRAAPTRLIGRPRLPSSRQKQGQVGNPKTRLHVFLSATEPTKEASSMWLYKLCFTYMFTCLRGPWISSMLWRQQARGPFKKPPPGTLRSLFSLPRPYHSSASHPRFYPPHPPRNRTGGRSSSVLWCLVGDR